MALNPIRRTLTAEELADLNLYVGECVAHFAPTDWQEHKWEAKIEGSGILLVVTYPPDPELKTVLRWWGQVRWVEIAEGIYSDKVKAFLKDTVGQAFS